MYKVRLAIIYKNRIIREVPLIQEIQTETQAI
jgi:hypothetical protein